MCTLISITPVSACAAVACSVCVCVCVCVFLSVGERALWEASPEELPGLKDSTVYIASVAFGKLLEQFPLTATETCDHPLIHNKPYWHRKAFRAAQNHGGCSSCYESTRGP